MNSLLLVAALGAVFTAGFCQSVAFKDCGSELANITNVEVFPCPSLPCQFEKNRNITFIVYFTPNAVEQEVTLRIYGFIDSVSVEFPLKDNDVCHSLICPLTPGTPIVFTKDIFISPLYPTTDVIVKVQLTSPDGVVACFLLPVSIV